MPVPPKTRTLVLNQDMTPLNIVRWKKGFKKSVGDTDCDHCFGHGRIKHDELNVICFDCGGSGVNPKCRIVEPYPIDEVYLISGKHEIYEVPSILATRHQVKRTMNRVPYSKPNVFVRDGYRCQYCAKKLPGHRLELEHVVPKSMWEGADTCTNWHNIVTSCHECNAYKRDRTPEQAGLSLRRTIEKEDGSLVTIPYKKPKQPSYSDLILGMNPNVENMPKSWLPYIKILLGDRTYRALLAIK